MATARMDVEDYWWKMMRTARSCIERYACDEMKHLFVLQRLRESNLMLKDDIRRYEVLRLSCNLIRSAEPTQVYREGE